MAPPDLATRRRRLPPCRHHAIIDHSLTRIFIQVTGPIQLAS
uniref:Uncharacterized protein n=1 Tax=Arundo donax TaxID=35708 RepID=A0A0A8ZBP8_ARUDO